MAALAYWLLQRTIIAAGSTTLGNAIGRDWKGKLPPLLDVLGIALSPWSPALRRRCMWPRR